MYTVCVLTQGYLCEDFLCYLNWDIYEKGHNYEANTVALTNVYECICKCDVCRVYVVS